MSSNRKEVTVLPTLKHLLEDLGLLEVKPDKVRIPTQLYDDIVSDAAEESGEEAEEE